MRFSTSRSSWWTTPVRWVQLAAVLGMWPAAAAGGLGWLPWWLALLLALPGAVAAGYMSAP